MLTLYKHYLLTICKTFLTSNLIAYFCSASCQIAEYSLFTQHTCLHQEGMHTYSGISCPYTAFCIHQQQKIGVCIRDRKYLNRYTPCVYVMSDTDADNHHCDHSLLKFATYSKLLSRELRKKLINTMPMSTQ